MGAAILISKSNNLYRQKQRFNRWQNRDRQSVLDGCNFSYSVIMRVMTFLVGVLKSASSIKMRIAAQNVKAITSIKMVIEVKNKTTFVSTAVVSSLMNMNPKATVKKSSDYV